MTVWLDNHLSPALARYLTAQFAIECVAVRDLGLQTASDRSIFERARAERVQAFVTKDRDFAALADRWGPPPMVILLTVGNTSTAHLSSLFAVAFPQAWAALAAGEALVEIGEA